MTQHVVSVRRLLKQRPISYGTAASVLRFNIRFWENFIYTLYTLINAEPCEIHSKITGVLITYYRPSVSLGVLLGWLDPLCGLSHRG